MQSLHSLEKSELIKRTQDLVVIERKTTLELIEHLREIERRLLFLEMGYSSLFEFAVKHLGLSEGSAQRRISAMKLIRDIPEAKSKLESGEITLSNASQVQTVFRAAKMDIEQKKETLEKIVGMTQRECQTALLQLVPNAAPRVLERERQITEERFELKLVITKELRDEIEELKHLLSHTVSGFSHLDLLKYLVSEELKRQKKRRGLVPDKPSPQIIAVPAPVQIKTNRSRKHIPALIKREIWRRAHGRCEAIDRHGRCSSRYQLELDHIVSHARGGSDSIENLRLYCRAHNVKHAIEDFGEEKMEEFR